MRIRMRYEDSRLRLINIMSQKDQYQSLHELVKMVLFASEEIEKMCYHICCSYPY